MSVNRLFFLCHESARFSCSDGFIAIDAVQTDKECIDDYLDNCIGTVLSRADRI
jgi:hypothetical protein